MEYKKWHAKKGFNQFMKIFRKQETINCDKKGVQPIVKPFSPVLPFFAIEVDEEKLTGVF